MSEMSGMCLTCRRVRVSVARCDVIVAVWSMDRGCIACRGGREGHDGSDGSDGEVLGTCLSCRQSWVKDVSHVAMAAIVAMEMMTRCECHILSGRQRSHCSGDRM